MHAKSRLTPVYPRLDRSGESLTTQKKQLITNYYIMKINQKIKTSMSLAAMGVCLTISAADAATIAGVTIEDVSSELTKNSFDRVAAHTLDGGAGYVAGGTNTHAVGPEGVHWLSQGTFEGATDPLPAVITFDLEGNYDLSSLTVWNYNEAGASTSRGANNVEILVASTVGGTFTSLGNFTFEEAPGDATTVFGEDHALTAAAADNTRLIRFNITSNHGDSNNFAGLSEVRFDGTAVPEPTTTALLGLGGLALILRRRK
jgi:hypothetical protein